MTYTAEEMPYKDNEGSSPVIVGIEALECMFLATCVQNREIRHLCEIGFRGQLVGYLDIPTGIAHRPLRLHFCSGCHTAGLRGAIVGNFTRSSS